MALKMKLLFFMVFGLFKVMNVNCVEQKCGVFESDDWFLNTYNGDKKSYYCCAIHNANLTDESGTVTTNTQLNQRSNDDVTLVWYDYRRNDIIKFIPNSLLTTFINLEYLVIYYSELKTFKPEFLKNANKLKSLLVSGNEVKTFGAKLFVEAANLEHINFSWSKIESIYKLAFAGLPNLQGVYIFGNKISSLHPSTFSFITKLNILELFANTCIHQRFVQANQKVPEVEAAIKRSCSYDSYPFELHAIEEVKKLEERQRIRLEDKLKEQTNLVTELEAKLNELNQKNEESLKIIQYQDEKFNQTNYNLSSIIEAHMINEETFLSTIANLKKKFRKSEKLNKTLKIKQEMDATTNEELNEKFEKLGLLLSDGIEDCEKLRNEANKTFTE